MKKSFLIRAEEDDLEDWAEESKKVGLSLNKFITFKLKRPKNKKGVLD
jgi:predicted HicB family RNase H-like nuclease